MLNKCWNKYCSYKLRKICEWANSWSDVLRTGDRIDGLADTLGAVAGWRSGGRMGWWAGGWLTRIDWRTGELVYARTDRQTGSRIRQVYGRGTGGRAGGPTSRLMTIWNIRGLCPGDCALPKISVQKLCPEGLWSVGLCHGAMSAGFCSTFTSEGSGRNNNQGLLWS